MRTLHLDHWLFALPLVGLSLVACGGGDSSATSSGSGPASPTPAARTVMITAKEYSLTPNQVSANVGERITFELHNMGTMAHGLEVELPAGDEEIDGLVNPGDTGELTVTMPSNAGSFEYYCPVPGHKQLGMVGTLTVAQGTATGH